MRFNVYAVQEIEKGIPFLVLHEFALGDGPCPSVRMTV